MTLMELAAKITLDTSQYDSGLSAAQSKMHSFGGALKSGFGTLAKLGAGALAGASTAVLAFGASSVKTGMTFDKSMSQVAATLGKTMDEMQNEVGEVDLAWGHFSGNLRQYAQEMGAHTAFSATEAADALNYMALAGYDTQKSMQMLPNVLNLAAAGSMDLANASDMVTDASSALGLSAEDTTKMVDQMAKASSKSNTSVEQLGSAMLTVGGTAKVLRGGTVELSTALGILADNGTKGAEGGTALRNILTSIQGSKFEKTFGEMGIKAYDAQGKLRSLKDVFMDMNTAMQGMTDEEKTDIINKTFNARDLKNVNALLGTSAQRWDELSAAIEDSSGAAQDMADTQLDNLAGDITLFKSALEGAQIALSDKLSPSLRDFVQTGSDGLSQFTEKLQNEGLASALTSLGDTLGNLAVIAVSHVPQLIEAGAQLLVGLAGGFASALPQLMQAVSQAGETIITTLGENLTGGNISSVLTGIADALKGAFESMVSLMPNAVAFGTQIISQIGAGITEAMPTLLSSATEMISMGAEMLTNMSQGFVQGIPAFLAQALPLLLQFTEFLRANAGTMISAGLEVITNLAQGIINSIPVLVSYVPQIITNLANIINDNAPKVLVTGVTIIWNLIKGIISAIPAIVSNIPHIIEAIVAVFLAFNWLSLGLSIINGIKSGITSLASAIPDALRSIGETAAEWISAINWTTVGADIMDLLIIGIQSLASAIPTAVRSIAQLAVSAFKSINWVSVGSAAISMLGSGIRGAVGIVKSIVSGMASSVVSTVKSGFTKAKDSAVKTFESLKSGVKSKIDSAKDAVKSAIDKIKGFFPINIGRILGNIKVPHFSLSTGSKTFMGKTITYPTGLHVSWHKKAMETPYMFDGATIFGAGEAGDEILYGRKKLMDDIKSAVSNSDGSGKTVYITNQITVDGAENPEDFANRLLRKLEMDVRMA